MLFEQSIARLQPLLSRDAKLFTARKYLRNSYWNRALVWISSAGTRRCWSWMMAARLNESAPTCLSRAGGLTSSRTSPGPLFWNWPRFWCQHTRLLQLPRLPSDGAERFHQRLSGP